MAWNIRWQCCFQSMNGTQYAVNIYERNYSGSITQLTGAAKPFVTSENDDEDIFTPIREQTGYLRVIDLDGTLVESIIPPNNTQRMVRLVTGTYSGGMFTEDASNSVKWQGFLQAQAFEQPWDGNATELELPVKSFLGALEDVQIGKARASQETRVAGLITQAFADLMQESSTDPYDMLISIDDGVNSENWLLARVQWAVFFNTKTINNQGDSYETMVGLNYYEALSGVLRLFGLTAREDGNFIYFAHYDMTSAMLCTRIRYLWDSIIDMADDSPARFDIISYLEPYNMMSSLTFKGADNSKGYLQGANVAEVNVKVDAGIDLHLNLPQTTEDASTVYEVSNIYSGQVFVQPHQPRTGSQEQFTFSEYQQQGATGSNRIGSSTYTKCLNNSVIFRPLYDPHYSSSDNLHTGAFPCRWYYKKDAASSPTLQNGLFLNQQYLVSGQSFTPYYCYKLASALSFRKGSGYLNIDMRCHNFMRGSLAGDSNKLYFGEFTTIWSEKPQTKLYFILTWGNKEWNGSEWITHNGNYQTFTIDFDGANVKSNKTTDMPVEGSSGWFIPVTEEMTGNLSLYILNVGSCETGSGFKDAHSRIIADLSVEYQPSLDMVVSKRSENIYRQQIATIGFSGEKSVSPIVGTYNNNVPSVVFLKRNATDYIETMKYDTDAYHTVTMRPELRLLSRIAAYYNQVRRTFSAVVVNGINVMNKRYTYIGKYFFGIHQQTDWREDTETIKFVEVT